MTIPPSWFCNTVPRDGAFESHTSGFVYTFDAHLKLLGSAPADMFGGNFFQLPVLTSHGAYSVGHDEYFEHYIYVLVAGGNKALCPVPESAILFQRFDVVYALIGRKIFVLEDKNLVLECKYTEIEPREIFSYKGRVYLTTDEEILALGQSFEIEERAPFPNVRAYECDYLLVEEASKAAFDLLSFEEVKLELGGELLSHLRYGCRLPTKCSRVQAFVQFHGEGLSGKELYQRVNAYLEDPQRTKPENLLEFEDMIYQLNPTLTEHVVRDCPMCAVPYQLSVGQIVDIESCKSSFYFKGSFCVIVHGNLLYMNPEGVLERIVENCDGQIFHTDEQILRMSAGKLTLVDGMEFATLPARQDGPCFYVPFAIKNHTFLLGEGHHALVFELRQGKFEELQYLQDVFEVISCHVFNEELFVVGCDETLAKTLYIFEYKVGQFHKTDDLLLENTGPMLYLYGILVDLEQNTLIDLDSRVIYRRPLKAVAFVRKKLYTFGVGLEESYLAEFSNFQFEFWVKKIYSLFCREVELW